VILDSTFLEIYFVARRAAQARARRAVLTGALRFADREDIEQEALIASWRAFQRYDPTRASLATFIERVVANTVTSLTRRARRVRDAYSLDSPAARTLSSGTGSVELHADVYRVLERMAARDRQLALALMEYTPSQASRKLVVSRSTIYEGIRRLRTAFILAGFGPTTYQAVQDSNAAPGILRYPSGACAHAECVRTARSHV
jgi:RNA polymerase sigma factor (sigma-70 family)